MQMPSVTRHQCPAPLRWPEQHCKITIAVLGLGSHPPQEMDPLLFVFLGMGLPHPGLRKKQDPKTRKRLSILVGWDLLGEKKTVEKDFAGLWAAWDTSPKMCTFRPMLCDPAWIYK